jgi:hypothetical protein
MLKHKSLILLVALTILTILDLTGFKNLSGLALAAGTPGQWAVPPLL